MDEACETNNSVELVDKHDTEENETDMPLKVIKLLNLEQYYK